MNDCSFTHFWIATYSSVWLLYGWCHVELLSSQRMFCVHCTATHHLQCHFIWSQICRVRLCLDVTCYLQLWQNDSDLLHATAETQRWNGYRNQSQHRKFSLEKNILPLLLPGIKPTTIRPQVQQSNHGAVLAQQLSYPCSCFFHMCFLLSVYFV